ncbi:MAG: hypothetical protein H6739_30765 [Alphaproteobacteria bacterium]|nr:hypothetical protein [Alphaproteobacteria bacterium]
MGTTQILLYGGREVKVTWDLEEHTTIPNGRTFWILRIEICNLTDQDIDIAVAENPWRAPDNTEKMQYDTDANGDEVLGSDRKYAVAAAKNLKLAPGECGTAEFNYDIQPGMAYTDIYERKPNGDLKDLYTWGAIAPLTPTKVSRAPHEARRTLVVTVPTPAQMFIDPIHDGPVKAIIERIDVPDGFELAHAFPGVGVPIPLAPRERGSAAALVLRQLGGLAEGERASLTIWQRVVEPHALSSQPARPVFVDLVNDRRPPEIEVRHLHVGQRWLRVAVTAEDRCAGVRSVEALIIGEEDTVVSVHPRSVRSSEGGAIRQVRFAIPVSPGADLPRVVLRATDMVGNLAIHALPRLSREPCP